jgi:hypothetical protein
MKGFLAHCRICGGTDLEYMEIPLGLTGKYIYRKYCKNCESEITIRRIKREDL